jgi:hypothetical protein
MQTLEKLIIGYQGASEETGIHSRRLQRLVEARKIRAIKANARTIMFVRAHLIEDLLAMEVAKIWAIRHHPEKKAGRATPINPASRKWKLDIRRQVNATRFAKTSQGSIENWISCSRNPEPFRNDAIGLWWRP